MQMLILNNISISFQDIINLILISVFRALIFYWTLNILDLDYKHCEHSRTGTNRSLIQKKSYRFVFRSGFKSIG